jgi:hypothetical protein
MFPWFWVLGKMGGNLISTDKSTILTWVSSEVVGGGGRGGLKLDS